MWTRRRFRRLALRAGLWLIVGASSLALAITAPGVFAFFLLLVVMLAHVGRRFG